MSKELEAFNYIKNGFAFKTSDLEYALDIIETALKEHELMKEIRITARFDLTQVNKEHKALEIIKETPEFAWYITIYENAYEMITDRKGFRVNESAEELQKKFDLLKEVLL